jgi:hypothetical protein
MAEPVRWPPRSELPRGLTIKSLPLVGTTWYDRGIRYWLRRAGWTALMAIGVAVATAILSGVLQAARDSSQTAFWVVVAVEVVFSVISGAYIVIGSRRLGTPKAKKYLERSQARTASARKTTGLGAGLGLLARSGSVLGQAFLVIGVMLFYGSYVTLFLRSLLPRLDIERQARYELAQQLRWFPADPVARQPDREGARRRHPGPKHHPSHHHR